MIKYLLDTHVVLWLADNSPLLSERAKHAFLDDKAHNYVSIASVWEVAIKLGNNRLQLQGGVAEFARIIESNGFGLLTLELPHLLRYPSLEEYHKDPFDRLLIATAICEDMTIITSDENIRKYSVSVLW